LSVGYEELDFQEVRDFPGLQKAAYRVPDTGEELLILALRQNVFHVVSANDPEAAAETVVINHVEKKGSQGEQLGAILGALVDWILGDRPRNPKKNCYTQITIVEWPDGHVESSITSRCDPA
jgi:hypothetical protein